MAAKVATIQIDAAMPTPTAVAPETSERAFFQRPSDFPDEPTCLNFSSANAMILVTRNALPNPKATERIAEEVGPMLARRQLLRGLGHADRSEE
jgi:hypothetical protein